MARTCDDCPKRGTCTEICAEVEAELPGVDAGRGVGVVDERQYALAGALSDLRGKARWRTAAVCALYYRCGWTRGEIASAIGCTERNIHYLIGRAQKSYVPNTSNSGNI